MDMAIRRLGSAARGDIAGETLPQYDCNVFIDRAGVRLFLMHAQFGQQVDDDPRLNFELPRQLIDSDFLHRRNC